MAFELVVALWEHPNFVPPKRVIATDTPDLGQTEFHDKTSAVGVHPGPNYQAFKNANAGREPVVALYEHSNFGGAELRLTAGSWANIHRVFNFGDIVSSVRFHPPSNVPGTIAPIPLVVTLFKNANFTGSRLVVVENSTNISADFGGTFNDVVTSVRVVAGPNFAAGNVARLFRDNNFAGGEIALPPGNFPNIDQSHGFNDVVSSIRVRS